MRSIIAIFILAAGLCLSGCKSHEDEPPVPEADYVKVDGDVTSFTAAPEGGDVMIRFTTNKEWSVELGKYSNAWAGIPQQSAGDAGENVITFTANPNTGMTSRSNTFIITAGRASVEITVKQDAVQIQLPGEDEVRKFLMQLYNDADGPNWRWAKKWGTDAPVNEWGPEVHYEKGRLKLYLADRNLKGKINLSGCKALVSIKCAKNQITEIDLSDCPLLTDIDATNVGLEKINLSGCLSLSRVSLPYNNLTELDIGWSTTLFELMVHDCSLRSLDLSRCLWLDNLGCQRNRISELKLPLRQRLTSIWCYDNELTSLDLSNSPLLGLVNCGENEITDLNVKGCPRLDWIYCYDNRLKSLDVSDQKDVLEHYYCYSNQFAELDLSGFRKLSELHCSDNKLTRLDITGCRSIRWLYCSYNQLEELDISAPDRENFERLDCSYNRLRRVDIVSMTKPLRIWCQGNRIGGEIPEHFDRLLEFEYDIRYDYRPETGTYTDRGYGWWYPGEPQKMKHSR